MKDKYCHRCGKVLIDVVDFERNGYCIETGVKLSNETKKICPTEKCGHYGKFHGKSTQSLWQMITNKHTCLECGEVYKYPSYDCGW